MIERVSSAKSPSSPPRSNPKKRGQVSKYYTGLLRRLQICEDGSFAKGPRAIGVTSCGESQGVTTVAVNLALASAAHTNAQTLLVDANTDHPSLHKIFRVPIAAGLIDAATGRTGVFDCIVETSIENLSLIPTGRIPNGSQCSYDPTLIEEVLDCAKHVFPLIVFDLPTAHELSMCFGLAGHLDGVVLVIEASHVDRAVAKRAKDQLEQANTKLLGVVYNKRRK